jgi:hypothetical protein
MALINVVDDTPYKPLGVTRFSLVLGFLCLIVGITQYARARFEAHGVIQDVCYTQNCTESGCLLCKNDELEGQQLCTPDMCYACTGYTSGLPEGTKRICYRPVDWPELSSEPQANRELEESWRRFLWHAWSFPLIGAFGDALGVCLMRTLVFL